MEQRLPGAARATVAIVDDHPLVREGLAARIGAQPDMEVCGEAADIESALELIVTKRPSLVIVDIALRDGHGIDLIKRIVAAGVNTRMLVVSAYDESLFAERALRAGALGYIAQAIGSKVAHGGTEALTDRELQIFQLIGRGKSTRDIAQELNVSVHTIDSHREHIRAKLNLRSGTELIQRAVQWHIENG
jgi:DNA-binding NarL/FixJ family response regulator